jgi:osmoprotectant transport system ATP-binding protein
MIEVINLSKHYGTTRAVERLSFRLEAGQTLALVGTSGSGKTTTLKMLNRLVEPTEGKVLLNGENLHQTDPVTTRRKMGYVIQHIGLFPHYTIFQNVAVVPRLLGWEEKRIQQRVRQLLAQLGIPFADFGHKYPEQLSGGQQQRVGIARALAGDPPIILMDEPFGALDPITRSQIRQEFKQLDELATKTTILITHDLEEAFEMGDLICVMDQGRAQQMGTARELLLQPANDFIREFVGRQKEELAYRYLKLSDLFETLPQAEANSEATFSLSPGLNIRKAVSQLSQGGQRARLSWQGQQKTFSLSQLLSSFYAKINETCP